MNIARCILERNILKHTVGVTKIVILTQESSLGPKNMYILKTKKNKWKRLNETAV